MSGIVNKILNSLSIEVHLVTGYLPSIKLFHTSADYVNSLSS